MTETALTPPCFDGTAQGMFDTVTRHLFKQGGPALDKHGSCAYRGHGSRSCAIGCLIPDARYTDQIEGTTAWSRSVKLAAGISDELEGLAVALQRAHDTPANRLFDGVTFKRDKLHRALIEIAQQRDLDQSVLDEVANAEAVS